MKSERTRVLCNLLNKEADKTFLHSLHNKSLYNLDYNLRTYETLLNFW